LAAALVVFVLLVVAACSVRTEVQRPHPAPVMRPRASLAESEVLCDSCCETERAVFLPGNDVERLESVSSADQCCTYCRAHETCLAWSWGETGSGADAGACLLKGGLPRRLTKVPSAGYVSGWTLQTNKVGSPLEVAPRGEGQSLFCFALVQPHGYEKGLVGMQYREGAGIFACDEYGVFSNRRLELAPFVVTHVVNSTLKCQMGGEFGTALNTGIFLAVWASVIDTGRFLYHDWTVKVDADSVFLPSRLRLIVQDHKEEERGVYLNNCQYGLHGPLEVLSRNAVRRWALGASTCVRHFWKLCSGPCGWGEDMFLDQCLERKLGVRRKDDLRQLLEAHCSPPSDWDSCREPTAAAFHPFKTQEGWKRCLRASESPSEESRQILDGRRGHKAGVQQEPKRQPEAPQSRRKAQPEHPPEAVVDTRRRLRAEGTAATE